MDLKAFFEAHPRVAIAFSGGVDSTYLVTAAAQYAQLSMPIRLIPLLSPALSWKGPKR